MEYALVGLLALTVICLARVAAKAQLSTAPSLVGDSLLVETTEGHQFRGVVHGQHADRWILRDAVKIAKPADQPLAGTVEILTSKIEWAQNVSGVVDR